MPQHHVTTTPATSIAPPPDDVERDVLSPDCPSRVILSRIGERWTMFVILALSRAGTLRFTELRATVGEVTPKVLTETLRALEADGLVERRAYADSPPRVEYSLTPLGTSLLEPIAAMREWAEQHVPEVLASRERATG
ncbi:winged helix-turn-helix transcriptional regulator [Agromyces lapidis]|uniref:Winged helix-turn-helix transcriptional regulator n=1 Tax=Agromyces lapidis TaxID=279574 RepID=A0ABV5SSP7_9MICO|nr:helix-turn-helix domain-containing protein [Agromyces lapidis]